MIYVWDLEENLFIYYYYFFVLYPKSSLATFTKFMYFNQLKFDTRYFFLLYLKKEGILLVIALINCFSDCLILLVFSNYLLKHVHGILLFGIFIYLDILCGIRLFGIVK